MSSDRGTVSPVKIFWLVVGLISFGCCYIILTTFCTIPKDNIRFADSYQGFIVGTLITTAIGYYLVNSPTTKKVSHNSTNDSKNESDKTTVV